MSDDLKPILMRLYQPRSQESFVFPTKWEAATKRSPQISNATYFAYTKTRTTILPHFLPNPLMKNCITIIMYSPIRIVRDSLLAQGKERSAAQRL